MDRISRKTYGRKSGNRSRQILRLIDTQESKQNDFSPTNYPATEQFTESQVNVPFDNKLSPKEDEKIESDFPVQQGKENEPNQPNFSPTKYPATEKFMESQVNVPSDNIPSPHEDEKIESDYPVQEGKDNGPNQPDFSPTNYPATEQFMESQVNVPFDNKLSPKEDEKIKSDFPVQQGKENEPNQPDFSPTNYPATEKFMESNVPSDNIPSPDEDEKIESDYPVQEGKDNEPNQPDFSPTNYPATEQFMESQVNVPSDNIPPLDEDEKIESDFPVQEEKENEPNQQTTDNRTSSNNSLVLQGKVSQFMILVNPNNPTKISIRRKSLPVYEESPINSDESNASLSDDDPTYKVEKVKRRKFVNLGLTPQVKKTRKDSSSDSDSSSSSSSSSTSSSSSSDKEINQIDGETSKNNPVPAEDPANKPTDVENSPTHRGRKRTRNPENWAKTQSKRLRNSGQAYKSLSKSNKIVNARFVKPPCTSDKCKLKCVEKIDEGERKMIFQDFWNQNNIDKQRMYIVSHTEDIVPKYKYTNAARPRNPNKSFFFTVQGKVRVRVCKTYFKNTLDITDRMIRTAILKSNENGFIAMDMRGRHDNHPRHDSELMEDIQEHINSIPRVESHYLRANTSREYIDGSKNIAELYRDFAKNQETRGKNKGNYHTYREVFNTKFNLGFFVPKKDQCNLCVSYLNSPEPEKQKLKEAYEKHQKDKAESRKEKATDRSKINENYKVAIYDLQAVLPCPRGEISAFYYKSKLNMYNFTITELKKINGEENATDIRSGYDKAHCYVWSEVEGNRGSTEIGSTILQYLKTTNERSNEGVDITFYSDNCCGQQKNKFVTTAYMYAVQKYEKINTITHKFLTVGHTQNEADNVHSLIEKEIKRNLKSGPIYTPDQYVTLIKSAKKNGNPFEVHELEHTAFSDLKKMQEEWGNNFSKDKIGKPVIWNDIKILHVNKEHPFSFFYKTVFDNSQNCTEVLVRRNAKKVGILPLHRINPKPAYRSKLPLTAKKASDLKELIHKNLIPPFYAAFYKDLFD